MAASVSRMRSLPAIAQPFRTTPIVLGGVHHHCVGRVRVFEGRLRIAVTQKSTDREDGFSLPQGEAGVGMAQIVKTDVGQPCLRTDLPPCAVQPSPALRSSHPRCREDPAACPLQPIENVPGRL